ncbi:VanZ family protein [Candidatus Pelagibacter sp. HIMB1611]|uniref:VanZ family protein n=1 Tax=unclassified Candidatus Pelagibacter TaxID=2647897 RepID=UPI003F86B345
MFKKTLFFFYENWKIYTSLVFIIITFLSLYPLKEQPSIPGSDKIHHLIAYSALAIGVGLRRPSNYVLIIILFSFYSGLIEIIQPYVNRFRELEDFIFNNLGILIGLTLGIVINKIINKNKLLN